MNDPDNLYFSPDSERTKSGRRNSLIVVGCLAALAIFACMGIVGLAGGIFFYQQYEDELAAFIQPAQDDVTERDAAGANSTPPAAATDQPPVARETNGTAGLATPAPGAVLTKTTDANFLLAAPGDIVQSEIPPAAFQDLENFYNTNYPSFDYYESAVRFGLFSGNRTRASRSYEEGDRAIFYQDEEEIVAHLVAVTDHTYFWVANDLDLDNEEVKRAASYFEETLYGPLVSNFGQVWDPGMDSDPRFSILHVNDTESDELDAVGFFNSEDEYPQALFEYSNEQEIIYLNMDRLEVGENLYYGTLVHEVQHLIQWYVDPSETTWLNEGFSQLAELLAGYFDTVDTVDYLERPETGLNSWSYEEDEVYAHYAGAYLFSVYLREQLGETAVQELVRHPANGMASVRAILAGYAPDISLEQLTAEWAVANLLDDATAGSEYYYSQLDFQQPQFAETVARGEEFETVGTIDQFGVNYIDLRDLRGPVTIAFAGDTLQEVISTTGRNGDNFWYAPPVDDMNAQLTASFDLSDLREVTLSYSVWYDLEEGYDYGYISVSTDEGRTWQTLNPENSVAGDFGEGFNGNSANKVEGQSGWLKETLSLDEYGGQLVQLRFEVLTDSGISGRGFALDNIEIPEYGYRGTFEEGSDGWQANGFLLSGKYLPQKWSVYLIEEGPETNVSALSLDDLNQIQYETVLGKGGGVLMIMPQTPFLQNSASYWLKVLPE